MPASHAFRRSISVALVLEFADPPVTPVHRHRDVCPGNLNTIGHENAGQRELPGVMLIQLEASAPRSILKVRNARILT